MVLVVAARLSKDQIRNFVAIASPHSLPFQTSSSVTTTVRTLNPLNFITQSPCRIHFGTSATPILAFPTFLDSKRKLMGLAKARLDVFLPRGFPPANGFEADMFVHQLMTGEYVARFKVEQDAIPSYHDPTGKQSRQILDLDGFILDSKGVAPLLVPLSYVPEVHDALEDICSRSRPAEGLVGLESLLAADVG